LVILTDRGASCESQLREMRLSRVISYVIGDGLSSRLMQVSASEMRLSLSLMPESQLGDETLCRSLMPESQLREMRLSSHASCQSLSFGR
ncbi:hypothetical protein AVEN_157317-1, partial [Araneus ventricosus]